MLSPEQQLALNPEQLVTEAVEEIWSHTSMEIPDVYIVDGESPNARMNSISNYIALTHGVTKLPPEELRAMIAHECGHAYYGHTEEKIVSLLFYQAKDVEVETRQEIEADDFAIRLLGTDAGLLALSWRSLQLMHDSDMKTKGRGIREMEERIAFQMSKQYEPYLGSETV